MKAMVRVGFTLVMLGWLDALPALAQTTDWWDKAWRRRRAVTAVRPAERQTDAFWVDFYNGGCTQKGGEDIRVVREGKPVPFCILWHAPGGLTRLAVKFDGAAANYDVYYDNPAAKPVGGDWRPQCGLLLETRRYRGKPPANLAEARKALDETAGQVMGRAFVENVFQGHNPFGPPGFCINLFRGWLIVAKDGPHVFSTTSDDASFLLIDGKSAVQWGGAHGAPPQAVVRETVNLTKGVHAFEYVHAATRDQQVCVAAWNRPGMPANQFEVIPASAFVKIVQGHPTRYEVQGAAIAPDFRCEIKGECHTEDTILVKYAFTDQSTAPAAARLRRMWAFGDGIQAEGRAVEHIYVRPALRQVTLTLVEEGEKGVKVSETHHIEATQDWARQVDKKPTDALNDYLPELRRWDLTKLALDDLLVAANLFRSERLLNDMLRAGRALAARGADLKPESLLHTAAMLVKAYGDSDRMRGQAMTEMRQLEAAAKEEATKAGVAVLLAEMLVRGGALKPAREEAQRLLKQYADAPPLVRRRALIVLGDVAREEGEEKDARPWYDKAEAIRLEDRRFEREAVRVGAFTRAIEDFIGQRRFDSAEELLDRLEWEYPTAKLDGYSTVLRGRVLWGDGRPDEAVKLLRRFVETLPKNEFADDALLLSAEIFLGLKPPKTRDATDAIERLLQSYPESARVKEAKDLLKRARETR